MPPIKHNRPSPSATLLGVTADPRGTMERLLTRSRDPFFVILAPLALLLVCIAPPLLQRAQSATGLHDGEFFSAVAITTAVTAFSLSLLLTFSVHAVGGKKNYLRAVVALAFSSVPITAVIGMLIVTGRLYTGSFSVVTFLATGMTMRGDLALEIFPYVVRASLVLAFITLAYGLRTIARSSLALGILMASFTIPLLIGSFIIGLTVTDLIHPATSSRTIEFFARFLAYPVG